MNNHIKILGVGIGFDLLTTFIGIIFFGMIETHPAGLFSVIIISIISFACLHHFEKKMFVWMKVLVVIAGIWRFFIGILNIVITARMV